MLDLTAIEEQFNENGYVVLPKLLDSERVTELQAICERILHQWLQSYPNLEKKGSRKTVACLTEPHYFVDRREELHRLLDLFADEWILSILNCICSHKLLFHDAQYFFNLSMGLIPRRLRRPEKQCPQGAFERNEPQSVRS